ncbi:uncharacterized protein KZ484_010514 isoform 2-T2 [Pholidichthys leucotaenia]
MRNGRSLGGEPQSVQPEDDAQLCESEWRSGAELLPQVKEEPQHRSVQTEERDSEGNSVVSHPPLIQTVSPLPKTPPELKRENVNEESRELRPAYHSPSNMGVHSNSRSAQNDSCPATEQTLKTPKADQQVKGLLHSNGKQHTHVLQMKNARTVRPSPLRPPHPSQSIQRWHSCKECGKGFSFACQLEVHMRWHTKEKPYNCTVCHKSFTTVSMLKRHHRIHTGEKPFRCHVCGKCFNQSAHLNTHFRLHTRERAGWSRAAQTLTAGT